MKIWVYLNGVQQGPFALRQLADLSIEPGTPVWFEGLPQWLPAGKVEQLRPLFDSSVPFPDEDDDAAAPAVTEASAAAGDDDADTSVLIVEEVDTAADSTDELEAASAPEAVAPAEEDSKWQPGRRLRRHELPDTPCPPTYLGWTIFLTVCCCSPLSLAGLIASICVTSFYSKGNVGKAAKASEVAAWLVMCAIALGLFPVILMSSLFGN